MYKLDIYRVVDGTDTWPLVETITGDTAQDCIDQAEYEYDQDNYHWTNPSEVK